ncbi:MAG: MMPL family transporter [Deltaproteobacteria bacterium]|nr:MMPL family transporter [Deltaproteobacteria bacterium]
MQERFLRWCASVVLRWPRSVLTIGGVLMVVSLWLAATRLQTNTDQDELVSETLPYHQRYKAYLRDFGDQEFLYILVERGGTPDTARQFVNNLTTRLTAIPEIKEVVTRIDPTFLSRNALLHLGTKDLQQLTTLAADDRIPFTALLTAPDLTSLLETMTRALSQSFAPQDRALLTEGFDFFSRMIDGMLAAATGSPPPETPLAPMTEALAAAPVDRDGYLTLGHGRFHLVLVMPEKDYTTLEVIAAPLEKIRHALDLTRREFPDITAGLTGRPVLAADEMAITRRDMTIATLLAFAAALLLFVAYFRQLWHPVFAALALTMGIAWTYGLTTLAVGSLNLLSSIFTVILVGSGMEFGLHIIARYREERLAGAEAAAALRTTIMQTGRGNLVAALTTAAAFFSALFTDFLALRELGIIAGSGILFSLLSMLLVLPAMIAVTERVPHRPLTSPAHVSLRWLEQCARRPRPVMRGTVVLTLLLLPGLLWLTIDHNLLNLQAEGLESVQFEQRLLKETEESTWQAVSIVDTPDDAAALAARLQALPTVASVDSIRSLVPGEIPEKMPLIAELAEAVGHVALPPVRATMQVPALLTTFTALHHRCMTLADQALRSGDAEGVLALQHIADQLETLRGLLRRGNPATLKALTAYQTMFMERYQGVLGHFLAGLHPQPDLLKQLPTVFLQHYISRSGKFAIYSTPRENVWDPGLLAAFVTDLRRIDPMVTGVPIEVHESSRLLEQSFLRVAVMAFVAILLIAWIDLRSVTLALLAAFPLALGLLWLFALMGWCRIPFTLANFFAIPILIGLGIDNGAQMIHRLKEDGGFCPTLMLRSTGLAVLLTSLTVVVSFGMLIFAQHRGIRGLGIVMTLGAFCILIATAIVLPALLARLRRLAPAEVMACRAPTRSSGPA